MRRKCIRPLSRRKRVEVMQLSEGDGHLGVMDPPLKYNGVPIVVGDSTAECFGPALCELTHRTPG